MSSLQSERPASPINYHSVPQDSLAQPQRESTNKALDSVDLTTPADAPPGNNSVVFEKHKPNIWLALTDASVIVAPLLFSIFAIYVWLLDSREVDAPMLARLRNAITVLATIFPILFASIVGRLVYEIARWKLDKGATVGTLEQLIGSQTVGATVLTQAKLGALNPLGISLLFVWAFSPLGGQSVLRMLGSQLRPISQNSAIVHYDTDVEPRLMTRKGTYNSMIPDAISDDAWLNTLYNSYTTLLLTPQTMKVDTMDIWMNVKIPFLESQANRSSDTWKDAPWNPSLNTYSSLVGIPVTNVPVGNTSFSLESSYIRLECKRPQSSVKYREPLKWNYTGIDDSDSRGWRPDSMENGTWNGFMYLHDGERATWGLGLDRFVNDALWVPYASSPATPAIFENETDIEAGPTRLFLQVQLTGWGSWSVQAVCDVRQEYVESRVNCSREDLSARQNCTATAQRGSQRQHAAENITPLSFFGIFRHVSFLLPRGAAGLSPYNADLSLQYLIDPRVANPSERRSSSDFDDLNGDQLGIRLSQLLNTYIHLSQMRSATSIGSMENDTFMEANITVPSEVTHLVEVYVISKTWAALFILSSVVLILGGVASVVFAHLANGPAIFGYVTTVLRDSRFIDLPPVVKEMDGGDIITVVKDVKIRYGHISREESPGSAIGVGREHETRPIKRRRPQTKNESTWELTRMGYATN